MVAPEVFVREFVGLAHSRGVRDDCGGVYGDDGWFGWGDLAIDPGEDVVGC